ncbi:MAG: type II toxin-antitoxin system prevent-host-death family antitoxin [Actinobacteria bacterium]|nr:MAG: type II toxin-antitoxin system prevent-host-death family antitoxin [Actinomycetota bacterium]RIK02708.1 MAG: type II toxin-antitoxin system prevent-host-death family antitoxin [Acidobacteriota bacterium]
MRELRNHGGEVVDRVARGERLIVTRSGKPVAELRPVGREPVPLDLLVDRWSRLPSVDPHRLRSDVDSIIDPAL